MSLVDGFNSLIQDSEKNQAFAALNADRAFVKSLVGELK